MKTKSAKYYKENKELINKRRRLKYNAEKATKNSKSTGSTIKFFESLEMIITQCRTCREA